MTAVAAPVAGQAVREKRTPSVQPSTLAWRSFRRDRVAMLGTLMVATLVAVRGQEAPSTMCTRKRCQSSGACEDPGGGG